VAVQEAVGAVQEVAEEAVVEAVNLVNQKEAPVQVLQEEDDLRLLLLVGGWS
jgi:hypothetical protein